MKLLYTVVCVFLLNSLTIQGQNFTFHHYGLEDGLSQITVRCLLKDSKGFLWLGTQDGLNRFDGTSFTVYKNQKNDSLTISGNFINALVEDNNGNIWIGTNDNGISIYDSHTNTFKSTTIKNGYCSSLSKTTDGNIIATVPNIGLVLFSKDGQTSNPQIISEVKGEKLQFNTSFIEANTLYLSTQSGRLFLSHNFLSPNASFEEISLYNKPFGTINTLFADDKGIWLGTSNGLFRYNTVTKTLTKIPLESNIEGNQNLYVSSIDVHKDTYYIGTFNGLFIAKDFNIETLEFNSITTFKGEQNHNNSISANRVYDTFTDGDLLWIGTNNLDVLTLKTPVFQNVNTLSNSALNNAFILSFTKNKDYVFVGTRKGINCINAKGEVTYITKNNTNEALAFNVIRAMAIDQNNYLWVGTIKGASVINLSNFDPKSPKITSFYHDVTNPNSLSSDATRGIYIDHNGSVWIMTYGGGVNRFTGDVKTKSFTFEHYKTDADLNSISSDFTYNMSQDKDLNYWITSEDGLNKLHFEDEDYRSPKFTNYFNKKNDTTSISSNTTLHTWHDADQTLWVATQDGFNRFNSETQTFKRFGKLDGLTNTFVYSITEDLDNNLWLTTNGGVFRFNKTTQQFTNYDQSDGLQSSEFNLGAHLYNKDSNEIYVGGVNGFNIFNPRKVSELDVAGNLAFTSLRIKDEEINTLIHPEIIEESLTTAKDIVLNHTDFPCYINFSDLDLRPNKNNQFIYSLNDNQWNELRKDSREIPLLSLPKGSHVLQIQGKSRNTIWDKPPLTLNIKVIPPWYQSNTAYLFYLLTCLGLAYLFYRLSLQRQLAAQESKRLQELDDLKSRFITNITHEFRTPLTLVLGYINTIKEKLTKDKTLEQPIEAIEQNSNNLLNLVNEMLDLAKLEKGKLQLNLTNSDIVSFTKYITNSFSSFAEQKNIQLKFSSEIKVLSMDFDSEKMRQILSNLISNAIKFSKKDSEVSIDIEAKTSEVRIMVTDKGLGISESDLPFVFDRFYQTEKNNTFAGSGIGLALTKELIGLMNGQISVSSKPEKGSQFIVTLPIKSEALEAPLKIENEQTISQPKLETTLAETQHQDNLNTILIVEDNPDVANYIASCLSETYNVMFALNGEAGLVLAKETIPDVVITDVMMPIMDGNELTEQLQNNIMTNHIPIIMLTAKALQQDKLTGIKSGADAYLTKPFQKEELLLRLEKLIEKRKQLQDHYNIGRIVTTDASKIKKDKTLEFLNTAVQHIHSNLENSEYNAIRLATDLNMSESQLYRKLKAITNKSSAVFIRSVRLEKAKELIQTTDLSISEIAYSTGFNDPNWFSKTFKANFKQSPSEIRN